MSWYKKSLRLRTLEEAQADYAEINADDVNYLVAVLAKRKELAQDLKLVDEIIGETGDQSETTGKSGLVAELAKLNEIWASYDAALRFFALNKFEQQRE